MVRVIIASFILSPVIVLCLADIQPKVLNGYPTHPYQFPYYAFIISGINQTAICGGTLISDRWVSTAAHCLIKRENIEVLFGYVASVDKFIDSQQVRPSEQFIHPRYREEEMGFDIGLIHLPIRVVSSKYVRPVTLSNNCGEGLDEETTLTVGMGGRNKRPILRYALLEIRSKDTCQQLLETEVGLDATSIICAYSPSQFIFNGDSGGPLIRQHDGALVGVTSFIQVLLATRLDAEYLNQAFTNVHYYNKWITKITGIDLPECNSANNLHVSSSILMICSLIVLKFHF